jgi:Pyruvate phosphate dikinase, AMP/ATP-binding domain
MTYIKDFSQVGRGDLEEAGGKGANLGELARAGFPVPPGFVLTTAAYIRTLLTPMELPAASLSSPLYLPALRTKTTRPQHGRSVPCSPKASCLRRSTASCVLRTARLALACIPAVLERAWPPSGCPVDST